MLTSMAIYSLYKYYKKWKAGKTTGAGGGDFWEGDEDSSAAGSDNPLLEGGVGGGDRDKDKAEREDKGGGVFHAISAYSKNAQINLMNNSKTVLICTLYMFLGPSLILLNKHILTDLQFPYPMFLSGLGVAVSALVARLLVVTGVVTLQRRDDVSGILWYKRVLPVGLAHAGTLAFGNIVYLLLNVGFIQMLKSFTPVIILLTSVVAKIENPNIPTIFSVFLMSVGTAATCSFTAELSILGLFVMFMAEFTEAIRLLMTQFLLHHCKFGVIEGQYVLAPATAFWLFMASAWFEGGDLMQMTREGEAGGAGGSYLETFQYAAPITGNIIQDATSPPEPLPSSIAASSVLPLPFEVIRDNPIPFILASCMGLCVNFMSYLVIQVTSSLTMKVLGSVRNLVTIILGVMLWGDVISFQASFGYLITMSGFVAYNMSKSGSWDRIQLPPCVTRHKCGTSLQVWLDKWDANRLAQWGSRSSSSVSGAGPSSNGNTKEGTIVEMPNVGITSGGGGGGAAAAPAAASATTATSTGATSPQKSTSKKGNIHHSSSSGSSSNNGSSRSSYHTHHHNSQIHAMPPVAFSTGHAVLRSSNNMAMGSEQDFKY